MKLNCPICKKNFDVFPKYYRTKKEMMEKEKIDMSKAKTSEDKKTFEEWKEEAEADRRCKYDLPGATITAVVCPNGCKSGPDRAWDKQQKRKMKKALSNPIPQGSDVKVQTGKTSYVIGTYMRRCSCKKSVCNINYIRKYDGEMIIGYDGDIEILYPDYTEEEQSYIAMFDAESSFAKEYLEHAIKASAPNVLKILRGKYAKIVRDMLQNENVEGYQTMLTNMSRFTCLLTWEQAHSLNMMYANAILSIIFESMGRDAANRILEECDKFEPNIQDLIDSIKYEEEE